MVRPTRSKRTARIYRIAGIIAVFAICAQLSACDTALHRREWVPLPTTTSTPDMKWEVKTDYSGLAPYEKIAGTAVRLHSGPLTELLPSGDYGLLLPYASAAVTESGFLQVSMYGLVTSDGIIVTDLIYDSIDRQYIYGLADPIALPFYTLTMYTDTQEDSWYSGRLYAVCALDGSWLTRFEYSNVVFADGYILMARKYDSYDIDVYDYDGRLLYNMLDLDLPVQRYEPVYVSDIVYSASEGYAHLLTDDGVVFIDLADGRQIKTDYQGASNFNEGLAPVSAPSWEQGVELWGAIDRGFNQVIEPRYIYPFYFSNGYAVAELPGNVTQIINKRGEALITVTDMSIISHYDGSGYIVYNNEWQAVECYSPDLTKFTLATDRGVRMGVTPLGGGWFTCWYEGVPGSVLFSREAEYHYPDVQYISSIEGEYLAYSDESGWYGAMDIEGRVIVPPQDGMLLHAVPVGDGSTVFISLTSRFGGFGSDQAASSFRIYDEEGEVLLAGDGVVTFDGDLGLFYVLTGDSYCVRDLDLSVKFDVKLMSYLLD
ncbi:MAG: WG repeat-containing protein [Oscillospiraceae bacterium]|nr:WG repeat-containing protein [Oscillospiraceae bacterium]